MITQEQEQWIGSLSDRAISIVPYDPRSEELFDAVTKEIHATLSPEVVIEHTGASSLGISGQDEIDVSIVTNKDKFAEYIPRLEKVFGPVQSNYPDRARFEVRREGKKIDLKIIDVRHPNYLAGKRFENYLRAHPEEIERYRVLKEECNGTSLKEYYRKKTEYINEILDKAQRSEN